MQANKLQTNGIAPHQVLRIAGTYEQGHMLQASWSHLATPNEKAYMKNSNKIQYEIQIQNL